MPELKDTPFLAYEFSEAEYPVAVVLTDFQYKHIQTEISIVATEKLAIAYNPDSPNADRLFLLTQEYMRGKLDALSAILITSDNEKYRLAEALKAQQENQQKE